jgi:hypothetical protein
MEICKILLLVKLILADLLSAPLKISVTNAKPGQRSSLHADQVSQLKSDQWLDVLGQGGMAHPKRLYSIVKFLFTKLNLHIRNIPAHV